MARKRKTKSAPEFPEMLVISMGNNGAYFTVHRDGYDNIAHDTIVGVYKLKRTGEVKVTRKLHKKD